MMTNRPRPEKHSLARFPLVDQAGQAGRSDPNVEALSEIRWNERRPDRARRERHRPIYGLVEGVDFG